SRVSRSRPAPLCSRFESVVMSPAMAARPARSGWARRSAFCRLWSAAATASRKATIIALRVRNGRASAAVAATQGECSAMSPKAATNSSSDIALTASRCSGKSSSPGVALMKALCLLAYEPGAELQPLRFGDAGLVAERHGVGVDRLRRDLGRMLAEIVERPEDDVLGWRVEALVARPRRMTHDAVLADDRHHLAVAHGDAGERGVALRSGEDDRDDKGCG